MTDRLIDTAAAAVACEVHPATIRRWVADGLLLNHGTPRRIRVDVHELLDLIDQQ